MKKVWSWINRKKKIILWIFIGVFWISATFLIYKLTEIKMHDKIQAWAIVTLAVITGIYAYQTFKLAQQEKISLNEQKKKRVADFWLERLKEFYDPLNFAIWELQAAIKFKPFPLDAVIKALEKVANSVGKGCMITEELCNSIVPFIIVTSNFKYLKGEEVPDEVWIDKVFKKSEELRKKIQIEKGMIEYKVNEVYGFYIDEKLKKHIEELKTAFNMPGG